MLSQCLVWKQGLSEERFLEREKPGRRVPGFTEQKLSRLSGGCFLAALNGDQAVLANNGGHDVESTGLGGAHTAYFARAKGGHPLGRVEDLASTIETHLVGLGLNGEGPGLAAMAATEDDLVEETEDRSEQVRNEIHLVLPPCGLASCAYHFVCR